ncbi:MAG TPA: hypothetical protein VN445_08460 [Rectinemataceae bacterium]|nr:hypothetical protein [Rectinemataceae bacterium]
MRRNAHKAAMAAITLVFFTLTLSGCDLIMNIIGGGDSDQDPITLPDSVADESTYDSAENDFFVAINKERTDNSVAAFPSRDASLEALTRRYARVGQCETAPENLKDRVAIAMGSCSDAASFIFKASGGINVQTAMEGWLAGPGGTASMRNAGFTKIGIGMTTCPATGGAPGDTWLAVCVILAKP